MRYQRVSKQKAEGATFTPKLLADFVANEIVRASRFNAFKDVINILDPAVGDGQLIDSLLEYLLPYHPNKTIHVYGYETNRDALNNALSTLSKKYPCVVLHLRLADFLTNILIYCDNSDIPIKYDFIIANPPYVRTQILGTIKTKLLAKEFSLFGRIDLYHAFIICMSKTLQSKGVAGIIVSNRFMSTKSGATVRKAVLERYSLLKVWDLGDTKLFDAAVLPAVLLANGINDAPPRAPLFSSVYKSTEAPTSHAANPIAALTSDGVVQLKNGGILKVQHGILDSGNAHDSVWRISTKTNDAWLSTVKAHTWRTFGYIGKIRVGVKTCSDKVFIRSDWKEATEGKPPELLRPLLTHHVARRFKALHTNESIQILYPHEIVNGIRRPVDIKKFPNSKRYLLKHKDRLEKRNYLIEAGRQWYELWVPQDPAAWESTKLVFRDISEKPTFWVDESGAIVNGDCYWLISEDSKPDLIWLAMAIANSSFTESFYDYSFCNKLYAGRRRFMSQYVEKFPLPDPRSSIAQQIIKLSKTIYKKIDTGNTEALQQRLDGLIKQAFGLAVKESAG